MALTAATTRDRRESGDIIEPGVAANAVIYQGGLVCFDGDGYIVPAAATAGYSPCVGVAQQSVDNTGGADGALTCRIYRGIYLFTDGAAPAALTVADNGSFCYASDDETVNQGNAGNRPIAGIVEDVTTAGVWVRVDNRLASAVSDSAAKSGGPTFTVRGASTANIVALATFTVAGVDGLTYVEGERILLKDQAAQDENGIYVVGTVAGGVAPLTRALDADGQHEVVPGMTVIVSEGTAGADSRWVLTTNAPFTVDTDNLVFTRVAELFATVANIVAVGTNVDADAGVSETVARGDHIHDFTMDGGLVGAMPAAANAGRVYRATDTPAGLYYDDGAAWSQDVPAIRKVTATITSDDLTTAGVGPETENIGAALPANAIVIGYRISLDDAFDNGAGVSLALEVGHDNDPDAYEDGFDCYTGSALEGAGFTYTTTGPGIGAPAFDGTSTGQIVAVFTAGADTLLNFNNGSVTVEVMYIDLA